jgi:hypothetical protein
MPIQPTWLFLIGGSFVAIRTSLRFEPPENIATFEFVDIESLSTLAAFERTTAYSHF